MSSTSESDRSPPRDDKYFEWLVSQNNELTADNKRLQMQLTEWKQNATENKERLNRIYQNRKETNYVDSFYDLCYRKLINNLTEQNVKLKSELCIKDISQLSDLRVENEQLRMELDESNLRVKDLEHDIKELSLTEVVGELHNEIEHLRTDNSKQRVRFSNVRNRLNVQLDIAAYVRSEFTNQRKEFIKLFSEHFLANQSVFIEQLESLDVNKNVPSFLFEPLRVDNYTSTREDSLDTDLIDSKESKPIFDTVFTGIDHSTQDVPSVVKDACKDPNKDSGVDTLPDEFREIMRFDHMRELNEATKKIEDLEKLLQSKDDMKIYLEQSVNKLVSEKKVLENECRQLQTQLVDAFENNDIAWKEVEKCRNEVQSLQTIIELQQGAHQHVEQSKTSSQLIMARRPEAMEPHKFADHHGMRPMYPKTVLVRDSPSKSDKSCPTETQDSSTYLARGPSPPRAAPPIPARSKSCDDKKVATESFSASRRHPESFTASQRHPGGPSSADSIKCSICNQYIAAEELGLHSVRCSKTCTL